MSRCPFYTPWPEGSAIRTAECMFFIAERDREVC